MYFIFSRQKHTGKINVWFNGIFLGEMSVSIKENKDIDWGPYRADKSLKMTVAERYTTSYIPVVRIGSVIKNLNSYDDQDKAAQAMLDFHRSIFENECD